jgi:hypothetical protein
MATDLTSDPTLVYLKSAIKETGMGYQEIVAALYNLTQAVIAICTNLDEDNGTIGADYLSKIGTPLTAAQSAAITKPHGKTTAS